MNEINGDIETTELSARAALSSSTWCHVLVQDNQVDERAAFEDLDRVTRRVRGRKMRTWDAVYDEFAAAWQFGEYFGENSAAFQECLGDLDDVWSGATGFVVVIPDSEQVLADEEHRHPNPQEHWLGGLVAMLDETAEWYAEPIPGPPDDVSARPALSFDVVLLTNAEHREEVVRLWTAAGAPLEP